MLLICALAWLPLFLLSAASGAAAGGQLPLPFLRDYEVHARLLLSLPLLLIAEIVMEQAMAPFLGRLQRRNLVPGPCQPGLAAALDSTRRLRESWVPETLLLVLIYSVGIMFVSHHVTDADVASWYQTPDGDDRSLSPAGYWLIFISLPIFQFVLARWYVRLFLWGRFLWFLSRIELHLLPAHPDGSGGLGFIIASLRGNMFLAAAHGALLTGYLSTRVVLLGEPIMDLKAEAIAMVIFVLAITLGPLLVFSGQLRRSRHAGLEAYGFMASRYVSGFDARWIRPGAKSGDDLLGSADIQSLSDMGGSFNLVKAMRTSLPPKEEFLRIAVATLLPLLPLLLSAVPLEQVMNKLGGMLF